MWDFIIAGLTKSQRQSPHSINPLPFHIPDADGNKKWIFSYCKAYVFSLMRRILLQFKEGTDFTVTMEKMNRLCIKVTNTSESLWRGGLFFLSFFFKFKLSRTVFALQIALCWDTCRLLAWELATQTYDDTIPYRRWFSSHTQTGSSHDIVIS